ALILPPVPARSAGHYLKFSRVDGDYAIVSIGVTLTLGGDGISTQPAWRQPGSGRSRLGAPRPMQRFAPLIARTRRSARLGATSLTSRIRLMTFAHPPIIGGHCFPSCCAEQSGLSLVRKRRAHEQRGPQSEWPAVAHESRGTRDAS